jgi:hypothetical protein
MQRRKVKGQVAKKSFSKRELIKFGQGFSLRFDFPLASLR